MKAPRLVTLVLFSFAAAGALLYSIIGRAQNSDQRSDVVTGDMAPRFQARTLDGNAVRVPDDFKGKVVLVDFWATWCGPCRAEVPNVVSAYQQYHKKGFDIVSISLDQPNQEQAVRQFAKDNKMTWAQVYDGGYWRAAVAVEYGVRAIPCPVIIDGDTGNILAEGPGAVGEQLTNVLAHALAAKTRK